MFNLFFLIFAAFGLIVGSFLNVVILRLNTEKSFGGRSGCMVCSKKLSWYELVPVFSFLFLRGRCKGCKTKISLQYPIIEIVSGLIFSLVFLKFRNLFILDITSFILNYSFYVSVFSVLLVIVAYDIRHKIIPDVLSFVFGFLSFLSLFLFKDYIFSLHIPRLLDFLSGPLIALPFAFLWLISLGRWMGFGDAKLALGIGWLLGISKGFSGLAVSFWLGALMGVFLLLFSNKKHNMKSEIPFAPYLALGTFIVFLFEIYFF